MNTSNNNATSNIRELLFEQMHANNISSLDILEWLDLEDNVCELIHEELGRLSNDELSGAIAQMIQDQAETADACAICSQLNQDTTMNDQEIHDVIVNNLNAFITRPNDAGEFIPEDNVSYLITQIKCVILELGYTDQQACDMLDDCFNAEE